MMEDKVLSIEKMQHLKKLGVNTDNASAVLMLYTENGKELGWDEVENHGKDKPLYEWYDAETETWESANIRIYDAEMGDYDHSYREECGTFTLQDMLEMMPAHLYYCNGDSTEISLEPIKYGCKYELGLIRVYKGYMVEYADFNDDAHLTNETGKTALEAAYNMLCWLAENKLLGKEEDK